jgi:hypothetical protein
MTVHFKYNLDSILSDDNKEEKENKSLIELKIRIEENIKMLKEQIYQLFDSSFKNKNELENIKRLLDLKKDNITNLFDKLNKDFLHFTKDIEDYKKITNERIEKVFKLIMITNEKLGNKIV